MWKLSDGKKTESDGRIEIAGAVRADLPQFFKDQGYKVGAEIGVYFGHFSETLCKAGLKLYAIDPWKIYGDYNNPRGQAREDVQYEGAKARLASYDCTIIRKTSMEALADIPDGSLDFVYIDANHMFPYVAQDIYFWEKKVRKGGCVSGHDFIHASSRWSPCDVKHVVLAYVNNFGIKDWYLLGARRRGPTGDRTRSWLWIKK
jgi:hypothetical protein